MRATFVLDHNNHAQSAIRPKGAPHTIAVGTPVVLSGPYRTPYGTVRAGAQGFVSDIEETSGAHWILMEGWEPALVPWDNKLLLMPYDTEDLLALIEFKRAPSALARRLGDYLRLVASSLIVF